MPSKLLIAPAEARHRLQALPAFGISVAAGQICTTGLSTVPLPIKPGDRVIADFGDFGQVGITIAN